MPYLIVMVPYEMTAMFLLADMATKNQTRSMGRLTLTGEKVRGGHLSSHVSSPLLFSVSSGTSTCSCEVTCDIIQLQAYICVHGGAQPP